MFLVKSYCDIGNYSAGYMAGISGQGWEASRAAFDALESVQKRGFSTEAMVSQAAEKAGFDRGHKKILATTGMKFKECYKKDESILGM